MSEKYHRAPVYQKKRAAVPRPPAFVYWCVRDSDEDGQLFDFVTVWYEQPTRTAYGNGYVWRRPPDGLNDYCASIWPLHAWQIFRTVPEDDIECIRIERDVMLSFDPRNKKPDETTDVKTDLASDENSR